MEITKPVRPLIVPPITMPRHAALPEVRELVVEADDAGFGVRLSQEGRGWIEAALFSLILNMVLMIMAGLFYWEQQASDELEVVVAQSEEFQEIELVEPPAVVPEVEVKQNLVLGSVTDAVTNIDLQQNTLAGAKAAIPTENFALDGLASGDNRARGMADGGAGNGIGDLLGGAFGDRLALAGAKTGDVQISLIWGNTNDLDLHVIPPSGQVIYFLRPRSRCNGFLDVDMNAGLFKTDEPVENVFWPTGKAPNGKYQVFVKFYSVHKENRDGSFQVAIMVNGEVKTFQGRADVQEMVEVATFVKTARGKPNIRPPTKTPAKATASSKTSF